MNATRFLFSSLTLGLAFVSAPFLHAQQDPHLAKAQEYYDILTKGQDMNKAIEARIKDITKRLSAAKLPPDGVAEVEEVVREWVTSHIDVKEVQAQLVGRIANDFSDEELDQLLAMLKTPVMQKHLAEGIALRKQAEEQFGGALRDDAAELRQKLRDIVLKYRMPQGGQTPASAPASAPGTAPAGAPAQ